MKRADAQVARMIHLFQRMDDIIDFAVLLRPTGFDIVPGVDVRTEAVDIGVPEIDFGRAGFHPFCHGLPDAAAVRDPHRFGNPEPANVDGLPEKGQPIRREGEEAVDPVVEPRVFQGGQKLVRRLSRHPEVFGREIHYGGRDLCFIRAGQVVRTHQ